MGKVKKVTTAVAATIENSSRGNIIYDPYKNVVEYEEKECLLRKSDVDLKLFHSVCEEIRNNTMDILTEKLTASQANQKIIATRVKVSLVFIVLRKLNRLEKFRIKHSRDKLHNSKNQSDSSDLQLQNLLYENFHINKEVNKCNQFKSKAEEVDLVPEEEFYKNAPEKISRPAETKHNLHQMKLARLEWELCCRKQETADCNELQQGIQLFIEGIRKKEEEINSIKPMLILMLKAFEPVQEALRLKVGPTPILRNAAAYLPHPLYFLFGHADSLREAGEKCISVKVDGDLEEATNFKGTAANISMQIESDGEEEVVGKRHGRRTQSRKERQEELLKQLTLAHPLSVVIDVKNSAGLGIICLRFFYLVNLRVVTVKPELSHSPSVLSSPVSSASKLITTEYILNELFPNDLGDCSPTTTIKYQFKQLGLENFEISQLGLGLPYQWAQPIAGIHIFPECLPKPTDKNRHTISLPCVIAAVKHRLLSRLNLCSQLRSLEEGLVPNLKEVSSHFPLKLVSKLSQWSHITWTDYQALGYTQQMIKQGVVSSKDILYEGALVRGDKKLMFAVAIKTRYPNKMAVFALQTSYKNKVLQASNDDSIRDIERSVNVSSQSAICTYKIAPKYALTFQVLRLLTCFDILLEASPTLDFPRDKLFTHSKSGKNRALPFTQVSSADGFFFTQ